MGCSRRSTRRCRRSGRPGPGPVSRCRTSRPGRSRSWGRGPEAVDVLERARADGLDVGADQYPYTAAATTLAVILPAAVLALPIDELVESLDEPDVRTGIKDDDRDRRSRLGERRVGPRLGRTADLRLGTHADWIGHTLAELAAELERDPADVAFDLLADDRLTTSVVMECMAEPDVEAILATPWIGVCTDAAGNRPDHPILGAGVPHPRGYGSAPRVLGRYVRDRAALPLEARSPS